MRWANSLKYLLEIHKGCQRKAVSFVCKPIQWNWNEYYPVHGWMKFCAHKNIQWINCENAQLQSEWRFVCLLEWPLCLPRSHFDNFRITLKVLGKIYKNNNNNKVRDAHEFLHVKLQLIGIHILRFPNRKRHVEKMFCVASYRPVIKLCERSLKNCGNKSFSLFPFHFFDSAEKKNRNVDGRIALRVGRERNLHQWKWHVVFLLFLFDVECCAFVFISYIGFFCYS